MTDFVRAWILLESGGIEACSSQPAYLALLDVQTWTLVKAVSAGMLHEGAKAVRWEAGGR